MALKAMIFGIRKEKTFYKMCKKVLKEKINFKHKTVENKN